MATNPTDRQGRVGRPSNRVVPRETTTIHESRKGEVLRSEVSVPVRIYDDPASLERLGTLLAMFPPRLVAVAQPSEGASHGHDVTGILSLPHNHRDPVLPNAFGGLKVYDPDTGEHLPIPLELGGGVVIYDPETGFALPMPEPDAPDPRRGELREP